MYCRLLYQLSYTRKLPHLHGSSGLFHRHALTSDCRSSTAGAGSRTRTYDLRFPKNFAVSETIRLTFLIPPLYPLSYPRISGAFFDCCLCLLKHIGNGSPINRYISRMAFARCTAGAFHLPKFTDGLLLAPVVCYHSKLRRFAANVLLSEMG